MDAERKDTCDLLSVVQTGLIENHINVSLDLVPVSPPPPEKV